MRQIEVSREKKIYLPHSIAFVDAIDRKQHDMSSLTSYRLLTYEIDENSILETSSSTPMIPREYLRRKSKR